jgi:hypothetical protein
VAGTPVGRVGEPDDAVFADDDVVRRAEFFAVEGGDEDGGGAVGFGADDIAAGVLAGDEETVAVERVAVRVEGVGERGDAFAFLPLHEFGGGDV